jgi:hypothetical protein
VRKRKFVLIAAAFAALGGAPGAGADGNGVVASANGGYGFSGTVLGGPIEVHPFAWNVQLHTDGSAHGRFEYVQVRNGVFLSVRGSLTCATFAGNRVWVGGIIEDSSRESLIGLDMWFQAQDNGEPVPMPLPTCRRRSAPGRPEPVSSTATTRRRSCSPS